ncbi:Malonyl CoA-acyl carrier protein transacylase [Sporotomaculum syntrophicum]|uniref:Malonyl CoA-acyl carrier protein transacylase n=1 Tax=Sporotomaculum syntrophicum TaxID=182264 RepID=A0A9D2WSU4_9FIRM|nr:ACP S-malonyltransferase [Sporotomaculum syntrophicum]KAF1086734.1 Malonyl CoA-acyl carrier protein transacylase [Sporotomaculum syntrophicum]
MMLAYVFPGQGSQFVGMGKDWYDRYDFVREIFDTADQALGFSLTELIFQGPAEELQKTANTQPAILTASVAMLQVLNKAGIRPAAAAGHSLGEYTALVAAGTLTFCDAVRLVRLRGKFMQEAVPLGQGGMMAVLGLDADKVVEGCRLAAEAGIVEAANFNSPGQVVVAGEISALKKAQETLKSLGAKRCMMLPVSAPFHSSLMTPAGERLAVELAKVEIKNPEIPVLANINADYYTTAEQVRDGLIRQVSNPVLWEQSIRRFVADGYRMFVEIGPGNVLAGLLKKIDKSSGIININGEGDPEPLITRLKEA